MSNAVAIVPLTTPTTTPPGNSFRPISRWQKILAFRLLWPIAALVLLLAYNALFTPNFFDITVRREPQANWLSDLFFGRYLYGSLIDILANGLPVAILAIGMTLVIATGGIDLSVGSVVAVSGAMAALLILPPEPDGGGGYGWPLAMALPVALLLSLAIGIANGLLVSVVRIQPIIATLIMMVFARGLAQKITSAQKLTINHTGFEYIGNGYLALLPFGVTLALGVFLIVSIATRRTALGLAIESIGDSPSASRYLGLRVKTIQISVYAISGLCAGIAGFVAASRIRLADPILTGAVPPMELDAIFAVVVGGTALAGGRFTLLGSLIGALLLQALGTTLLSTRVFGHDIRPDLLPMPKALVILIVCLLQSSKFRSWLLAPFRSLGRAG
jgi:simple sugar transport system permease protein